MKKINVSICVAAMAAALFAAAGCSSVDGEQFKPKSEEEQNKILNLKTCKKTSECGVGRFCNEEKLICDSECSVSRDCYFKDEAAMAAWKKGKEAGLSFDQIEMPEPKFKCSPCGTCMPVADAVDSRCFTPTTVLCSADEVCAEKLDERYKCGADGYCNINCETNEDCNAMGPGHHCEDVEGRKQCVRWCHDESHCAYYNFKWKCKLPDGVDESKNFFTRDAVDGRCVPAEGVDYGKHQDATKESAKFVGIWGGLNETAFTNCGFPLVNCMNTTNIHHILFRIRQTEKGIEMQGKYCYHQMKNFKPLEDNPTMDQFSEDDNLSWMESPTNYVIHVPYHYFSVELGGDQVQVGTKLQTSVYLEIRGALLNDRERDPLPSKKVNFESNWDQDEDGHPGMTTFMNGVLTGEIYQDVRYYQSGVFEVVQLDNEGKVTKMKGLLTNDSEQYVLGSSKPILEQDVVTTPYTDPNRNYMRFMRLSDDATCQTLIDIGRSETNCDSDINKRKLSVDDDKTWLCHTPTLDGPSGEPPAKK